MLRMPLIIELSSGHERHFVIRSSPWRAGVRTAYRNTISRLVGHR